MKTLFHTEPIWQGHKIIIDVADLWNHRAERS